MRRCLVSTLLVAALVTAGSAGASSWGARDALRTTGDGPKITIVAGTPTVGSSTSPTALPGAAAVAKRFAGIPQHGLILGNPHAPVTLIEYVDFQCPICAQFETKDMGPLLRKFVRPGKLKIRMQPWAILDSSDVHDSLRGQKATIGAAGQNKAFNFAEVLYDNQGVEGTGWLNDTMISNIAASVDGLKTYRLATRANGAATQRVIRSITRWARAHPTEMTGTPTLYLKQGNGNREYFGTGVPDLARLVAAIKALLA
jgi:protein-disulfide isomerase